MPAIGAQGGLSGNSRPAGADRLTSWAPRMLAILRIMTGLLFLEHGLMKLVHFPAATPGLPDPLPLLIVIAGLIELVGGCLIAVGFLTRIAAFICSGEMAAAYFMGHAHRGFWPGINGGGEAILFCFVFLYFVFAGPGAFSLDGLIKRGRSSPAA